MASTYCLINYKKILQTRKEHDVKKVIVILVNSTYVARVGCKSTCYQRNLQQE